MICFAFLFHPSINVFFNGVNILSTNMFHHVNTDSDLPMQFLQFQWEFPFIRVRVDAWNNILNVKSELVKGRMKKPRKCVEEWEENPLFPSTAFHSNGFYSHIYFPPFFIIQKIFFFGNFHFACQCFWFDFLLLPPTESLHLSYSKSCQISHQERSFYHMLSCFPLAAQVLFELKHISTILTNLSVYAWVCVDAQILSATAKGLNEIEKKVYRLSWTSDSVDNFIIHLHHQQQISRRLFSLLFHSKDKQNS